MTILPILASSRLIVTRTGGWKTALGAIRSSPALPGHNTGKVLPASATANRKFLFLGRLWKLYGSLLEKAPIRTQGLVLSLIWCAFSRAAYELPVKRVSVTLVEHRKSFRGTGDLLAQSIEGKKVRTESTTAVNAQGIRATGRHFC